MNVAFDHTTAPSAAAVPAVMRRELFNPALCRLIISSSFKVELPRVRFARQCDQTKAKRKKKCDRIITETSFMLSWVCLNVGEQAASAHFTPLILLGGERHRLKRGLTTSHFWYHGSTINTIILALCR